MLTVTIPSTGRPKFLEDCIESIYNVTNVYLFDIEVVVVCCDPQDVSERVYQMMRGGFKIKIYVKSFKTLDAQRFAFSKVKKGHVLYLADDVVLDNDCLEKALAYLEEDSDRCIDLVTTNIPHVQGCFMVVGEKFCERFKDRQIFCPEYELFYGAAELRDCAKKLKKYVLGKDCKLKHFHPCCGRKPDKTHIEARSDGADARDQVKYFGRSSKEKIWGYSEGLS
ncbi:MAG: glycosyltransferase [Nanoarchaeota archaeon]|nr:glycosyltransferase [Nanoarchaeota archaeon]